MASSSQFRNRDSPTAIDFDLIMPSSERRMDLILPGPVFCLDVSPALGEAQGKKGDSSSSSTPLKLLHQISSASIEGTPSPDPRWPLLNRWSASPIPPVEKLRDTITLAVASSTAALVSPQTK